jgi:hypothetical protein
VCPNHRADAAVLEQVGHVLHAVARPDNWPAFRRAWAAQLEPETNDTARIAQLERDISKLNDRLARAAALLTDGTLDSDGYRAPRDRETVAIRAAETEIQRLTANLRAPASTRLPPAQAVFE